MLTCIYLAPSTKTRKDKIDQLKFAPTKVTWIKLVLPGGFEYFLFSPRNLGKMNPFWRAYFSKGLVQPPTRVILGLAAAKFCHIKKGCGCRFPSVEDHHRTCKWLVSPIYKPRGTTLRRALITRWCGFNYFFMFTPKLGEDENIWQIFFSDGLVQPPTTFLTMVINPRIRVDLEDPCKSTNSPITPGRSGGRLGSRSYLASSAFDTCGFATAMKKNNWLFTLPETNISPIKMVVFNRNLLFQGSIFRGELLVSGRVDCIGGLYYPLL